MTITPKRVAAAVFAGFIAISPAVADAIDGNWCSPDGKTLSISGPEIVTPGGNRINGNYDRHFFSYVIPGGEPGTGHTMRMTLLGEYAMRVEPDTAPGTSAEVWNRCMPRTSGRAPRQVPV